MFKSRESTQKKCPCLQSMILKGKSHFFVIWQIYLLEEEDKGLRRPPTPLEAFKHHLPSQSRIFVEQVFKIPHRYVHFIPLFFYLFHGLFERFLAFFLAYFFDYFFAYFLAIFFFYFTIELHAQKYEKQSQCKRGV